MNLRELVWLRYVLVGLINDLVRLTFDLVLLALSIHLAVIYDQIDLL